MVIETLDRENVAQLIPVSIPKRDYWLLKHWFILKLIVSIVVSIPKRDYWLLKLDKTHNVKFKGQFQSLRGIIGYWNLELESEEAELP